MLSDSINPINGRTDIDLALRFQRAIATANLRGLSEFGTEMVFDIKELHTLAYAMQQHLKKEHYVQGWEVDYEYQKTYGDDKDLWRTVYTEPKLTDPGISGNGDNS